MTAYMKFSIPELQSREIDADAIKARFVAGDITDTWATRKLDAKSCADFCRLTFANHHAQAIRQSEREAIAPFVASQRVVMPESVVGWLPEKLRLESGEWWSRRLKKRDVREAEHKRMKYGKVQKYCSDELLKISKQNQIALNEWLERTTIESDSGEVMQLKSIADKSVSNPRLRRNELMVRIKGMEQHSAMFGHCGRFITPTAPSTYHRSKGDNWNGWTPKQVQKYMVTTWAQARAELARCKINIYGIRIAEPHKDACPHWHLLLWFESTKQAKLGIKIIRDYFLKVDGGEKGALINRVKTITINPLKGGAIGYIAKYVCKNIDGAYLDEMHDRDGKTVTDGKDGAARVKAWASAWGARQFQFIGGAPIGLWRELRRIRNAEDVPASELFLLWHLADSADYCGFMIAYKYAKSIDQKPNLKKYTFLDDLALLAKKYDGIANVPDDEITKLSTLNKYQEPKSRLLGVEMGAESLITRTAVKWKMKTTPKTEGFVTPQDALEAYAVTRKQSGEFNFNDFVEFAATVGAFADVPKGAASWTCGNNCTG